MKKSILYLAALLGGITAIAAPNDTTVVVAHNNTQLTYFGNYDALAAFPNGSTDYRKIVMEFNIGKYPCPGYDPNTAGEGPGRSGWCADWDYDVHAIAMTPTDTIEIGRLITPYANNNNISTPATWNHSYFFDLTDYYTILKDDVQIRIHYAGYSGGFTGTIKFHMIEGTRARDVLGYAKLWNGSYRFGDSLLTINQLIEERKVPILPGTEAAEIKSIITGHGGDNQENCAEFCRKYYRVVVNNTNTFTQDVWRNNCNANFLYPQSGTWIYNRANWCPGDLVKTLSHPIPNTYLSNDSIDLDLNFQNYIYQGNNPQAIYKIAANLFYYSASTHTVDVGIEDIISPNSSVTHNRSNPEFSTAKVKLKNYGADASVSNIEFKYGVNGSLTQTYLWTGTVAYNEEFEVTLPLNGLLDELNGDNTFTVAVDKVNGNTDGDSYNNEMTVNFKGSPIFNKGSFLIEALAPGGNQQLRITLVDVTNGTEILNKSYSRTGSSSFERIELPKGVYKITVDATGGAGLNFFNLFATGIFKVHTIQNTDTIRLEFAKTDLDRGRNEGNFGAAISQSFRVSDESVSTPQITSLPIVQLYPNPSKNQFQITIDHYQGKKGNVSIYNVVGQKVHEQNLDGSITQIPHPTWAAGVYNVVITLDDQKISKKLVVE